ncbi:unnamed protein product [Ectocarpus sp. CCAP 1310/34]|nr:unnamed protein product [Ectocarpus sp. CCAP 1310/34]
MPLPNDVKQLRSLLGGLSYYRKFIKDLAVRVKPLTDLLRMDAKVCDTPAMADTVKELLAKLSEPPVLAFPYGDAVADGSRPLRLCCVDGFGAALEQEQVDGSVRPILFVSRATLESERNWIVLDLEAGGIVWAIKHLRGCFWSTHFLIYLDHKALDSIVKVGEHNARLQRWLDFLPSFNYTLAYRKGAANANADFFPGCPCRQPKRIDTVIPVSQSMTSRAFISFVRADGVITLVRHRTSAWVGLTLTIHERRWHTRL